MRAFPLLLALGLAACSTAVTPPASTPDVRGTQAAPETPTPVPTISSPLPENEGRTGSAIEGARPAETSAPVKTRAPGAATPTPDPAVWRYEGTVVDASGEPLEGVCVAIGPHGCQRFSPHTDERGAYFFDVPQNETVVYDLTFVKEGYEPVFHRARPSGPTVFNVVLGRPGR